MDILVNIGSLICSLIPFWIMAFLGYQEDWPATGSFIKKIFFALIFGIKSIPQSLYEITHYETTLSYLQALNNPNIHRMGAYKWAQIIIGIGVHAALVVPICYSVYTIISDGDIKEKLLNPILVGFCTLLVFICISLPFFIAAVTAPGLGILALVLMGVIGGGAVNYIIVVIEK